jgi:hypothetical protein
MLNAKVGMSKEDDPADVVKLGFESHDEWRQRYRVGWPALGRQAVRSGQTGIATRSLFQIGLCLGSTAHRAPRTAFGDLARDHLAALIEAKPHRFGRRFVHRLENALEGALGRRRAVASAVGLQHEQQQ